MDFVNYVLNRMLYDPFDVVYNTYEKYKIKIQSKSEYLNNYFECLNVILNKQKTGKELYQNLMPMLPQSLTEHKFVYFYDYFTSNNEFRNLLCTCIKEKKMFSKNDVLFITKLLNYCTDIYNQI